MFLNVFCAAFFPNKPGKAADEEAGQADVAAADRDVRRRVDPLSRAARAAVHHQGMVRPCRDAAGSRGSKPVRAPRPNAQDEDKWVCDAAFARLVREVLRDLAPPDVTCRVQSVAQSELSFERVLASDLRPETLRCLRDAATEFLTGVMEDGHACARHAKRVTLTVDDLRLAGLIRSRGGDGRSFGWQADFGTDLIIS